MFCIRKYILSHAFNFSNCHCSFITSELSPVDGVNRPWDIVYITVSVRLENNNIETGTHLRKRQLKHFEYFSY